jgi:hypothetical protein
MVEVCASRSFHERGRVRLRMIVLAGAGLGVLSGCSGGGTPHSGAAIQTKSNVTACQDFNSWYQKTDGDWSHANAAMLLLAGVAAPSGGQLYHDIGNLTSVVLFASKSSGSSSGQASTSQASTSQSVTSQTVTNDVQTVQQECQSLGSTTSGSNAPASTTLSKSAEANAKRLAQALAGVSASALSALANQSVTGAAMISYVRSEAVQDLALATADQLGSPETVTKVVGGWSMCPPQGSAGCDTLTGIKANAAGLLTDVQVNGQPVASRLSVGTKTSGGGLTISWVAGYYVPSSDLLRVTFKVRNDESSVFGTANPAFLPVFAGSGGTQLQYDKADSLLPGPIQPGQTSEGVASFQTQAITGTFSLQANGQTLVGTPLRKP